MEDQAESQWPQNGAAGPPPGEEDGGEGADALAAFALITAAGRPGAASPGGRGARPKAGRGGGVGDVGGRGGGGNVNLCRVQGCGRSLAAANKTQRRCRVCSACMAASQLVLDGAAQRFCQQCGRFHVVSEFDGSAHSCRRQLALHNERRRKAYAARKGVTTVNPPRGTATGGLYNPVTGAGALLGGGLLGDPSQLYGGAQLLGMGAHPGFAVIHPAFLGSAAGQGGLVHGGSGYVLPSGGPFSLGFDPSGGSATLSALVPAALAAVAAAAQAQAQAQAQAAHMPHGGNNMAVQQAAMQAQHASQVALALLNNAAGIANAEWRGPQQQG